MVSLTASLLKKEQTLQHCHYFTARIKNKIKQSQDANRQTIWLDALTTRENLTCHYGKYLQKSQYCKNCKSEWAAFEEKMTDVNIASQVLVDAYEDRFDTALSRPVMSKANVRTEVNSPDYLRR